ncbi:sigma-54-dependent Fis family transcriptional regulator, partial [bacterium]|nr:sigma-54-dependent Fis family transcriptional regulator [candidate division CSSED10-310 bacterium]
MSEVAAIRTLLIIDDDPILCDLVRDHFSSTSCHVLTAHDGRSGLDQCSRFRIDIVLLDQKLPDGDGHLLCSKILKCNEHTKIIFITGYSSFDNAVRAVKAGAFDYVSKPFELEELELAVEKALQHTRLEKIEEFQSYQMRRQTEDLQLVGEHPAFRYIEKLMDVAARSDVPVLITGETGTGKSVIAKKIHYSGACQQHPFIAINCNSLPDHLFEAELFGYERGAFTDAQKARKGIFAMADGGSLLLDEIGCMPMHLQSKLLTVLDERKFKRLGGDQFVNVTVRILAATNADLKKCIGEKIFREDLFYRLNVIRIHVPPLRERIEDLPMLVMHLLEKMGMRGIDDFEPSEWNALKAYSWPGNIRELKNILERAVIFQEDGKIRPSVLLQHSAGAFDYRMSTETICADSTRPVVAAAIP